MQRRSSLTSILPLFASGLLMVGCEQSDDSTSANESSELTVTGEPESKTPDGIAPDPAIADAVAAYQRRDPDAIFTWFSGQVDSFATRPKATIPDYALPTLKQLGLSTTAREPLLLSPPVNSAEHPNIGRKIDELGDLTPLTDEELGEQVVDYIDWDRPDEATIALEAKAALPILAAFLQQHRDIFGVSPDELDIALTQTGYRVGAFARYARFQLMYDRDEPIIDGFGLVEFDANWNIISISRMIVTPNKIPVAPAENLVDAEQAHRIAMEAPLEGCEGATLSVASAVQGVEPISRRRMWEVDISDGRRGECHYRVSIDASTGEVLNVSDLIMHYTDAVVRRWGFTNGDQTAPTQLVTSGIYTRDASRLEHDFFYLMNDNRCEGDPQVACSEDEVGFAGTDECLAAYSSYSSSTYIRGTNRPDRDWSIYYPNSASESFSETNTYFWARWFTIWMKPALDALGTLPPSTADYERALIITDRCQPGGAFYNGNSIVVSTESDKGEGNGVVRLARRDPTASSSSFIACEGGGCYESTGTLTHEMNHFFLDKYMNVPSVLNCNFPTNETAYTHEGILGSTLMQAFWHYYYNIGYDPADTDMLYHSDTTRGRVHVDNASLMKFSSYDCGGAAGQYTSGRVGGQVMWKIYHGKKVTGSTETSIARPATDTDFIVIAYEAAERQAASTFKTRSEYAFRVMEIIDTMGQFDATDKADYCGLWDTHELASKINVYTADVCQ
ncbi:MAG: PepSY domain-containing protein [Deltaproteobacteria bacterium]|nr:PepSY domain-containing protein [Deltaproteobacteria bacterium]